MSGTTRPGALVLWLVWALYGLLGAGFVAGAVVAAVRRERAVLRAVVVPVAFMAAFPDCGSTS